MSILKRMEAPNLKEIRMALSYTKDGSLINNFTRGGVVKGQVVGNPSCTGYLKMGWKHKIYQVHHIAYYHQTGIWANMLDHINGIITDNRISNLREVNQTQNARNTKLPITNTSGVCGVQFHKHSNKWVAVISENKKVIYLGYFINFEDAVKARKAAEVKYGYHANHGKLRA